MARAQSTKTPMKTALPTSRATHPRRRPLVWLMAALLVVIVAVLSVLLVERYYVRPNAYIAKVNGTIIRARTLQKFAAYQHYLAQKTVDSLQKQRSALNPQDPQFAALAEQIDRSLAEAQQGAQSIEIRALQDLIDDELIRQGTREEHVDVTERELQREIQDQFSAPADQAGTASGGAQAAPLSPEEFSKEYAAEVERVGRDFGMTEAEFRDLFYRQLLRTKMTSALGNQVSTVAEQVHVKDIVVATEAEARAIVDRVNNGEDFASLASALSRDSFRREIGGDLGWFSRGTHAPNFENVAFSLKSAGDVQIAEDGEGFHVVMLVERAESRALDAAMVQFHHEQALQRWLAERRSKSDISYNVPLYQQMFMEQ